MEPGPTAEPRRLNTSLLRLLNIECRLGEPKSHGLNWNRRDMYIRNGMHCICQVNMLIIREKMREMKLDHRNYLDLNEKICFQAFRPCKTQTNLLSYRDKLEC